MDGNEIPKAAFDVSPPPAGGVGEGSQAQRGAVALKRKKLRIAGLSAFAVASALLAWHFAARWHAESTDNAYVKADAVAISPRIAGYVQDVLVTDNQRVTAGQTLVVIDDRDFWLRVDQAQAARDAQESALAALRERRALQGALIRQAQATHAGAQAQSRKAVLDLQRDQQLIEKGYASIAQLDSHRAQADSSAAESTRASAGIDAARGQAQTLVAEEAQAAAKLHEAEAALAAAKLDLEYTRIKAPFDGVIGNKAVEPGRLVKAGTQLYTLVPLDQAYVIANFKETQLRDIRVGQGARVRIDAFDGELEGTVDSISPSTGAEFSLLPPENATGNFTRIVQWVPVKIVLARNSEMSARIRSGLSVVVTVDTRAAQAAPVVASAH